MADKYKNEIEQVDNSVNPLVQNQLRDIFGSIEVVSAVPTEVPVRLDQQIKIYVSGGTSRFYIYDTSTATWKYSTLT